MKAIAWCMAAMLATAAPCWAAGAASKVDERPKIEELPKVDELKGLPKQEPAAQSGMTCYMPYAASRDHLVTGCEVPGYRMQFELAKAWGMFMVLLPDGTTAENARVYFAVGTPESRGMPPGKLLEDDLKGVQANRPGTRVLNKLTHTLPVEDGSRKPGKTGRKSQDKDGDKNLGKCVGVSLAYAAQNSHFPYETYFICDTGSKRYALLLSLSAMTKQEMDAAMPDFLKWMDVPQTVRDVKVSDAP